MYNIFQQFRLTYNYVEPCTSTTSICGNVQNCKTIYNLVQLCTTLYSFVQPFTANVQPVQHCTSLYILVQPSTQSSRSWGIKEGKNNIIGLWSDHMTKYWPLIGRKLKGRFLTPVVLYKWLHPYFLNVQVQTIPTVYINPQKNSILIFLTYPPAPPP